MRYSYELYRIALLKKLGMLQKNVHVGVLFQKCFPGTLLKSSFTAGLPLAIFQRFSEKTFLKIPLSNQFGRASIIVLIGMHKDNF